MKVIFCSDPLDNKQVDSMYHAEAIVVGEHGLAFHLIEFEDLIANNVQQAIRRIPNSDSIEDAIYRGWMLKPKQYQQLYTALLERGIRLINTPEMYLHCHYLPASYPVIKDYTPYSVWLAYDDTFSMETVHALVTVFGCKPIIVKDYVKSQKHYWHEACYIPDASDKKAVERIVEKFLELQDTDLNEGLVFREFVEFQPLTQHSKSEMPLTQEYRVFMLDGKPIVTTNYWSEGDYPDELVGMQQFEDIMQGVNSRFYTMDVARQIQGEWMIVELGDAQVAGLPDHMDINAFYEAIIKKYSTQ